MRLGLCCLFHSQPVKWRTVQAGTYAKLSTRKEKNAKIIELTKYNAEQLLKALKICVELDIRAFRIQSDLWPLATHPEFGYGSVDLRSDVRLLFMEAAEFAKENRIRLSSHPNMIHLGSEKESVIRNSLIDLAVYEDTAELLGIDVINIHGGGSYGDKKSALERFRQNFLKLPEAIQKLLTLENDDRIYTVEDLLPICRDLKIPLVYDVHHHRCNPDSLSIEKATELAIETWGGREPLFHISSPRGGWGSKDIRPHADYIDVNDFPRFWTELPITVEVEAKHKEVAISKLKQDLGL